MLAPPKPTFWPCEEHEPFAEAGLQASDMFAHFLFELQGWCMTLTQMKYIILHDRPEVDRQTARCMKCDFLHFPFEPLRQDRSHRLDELSHFP